jgi:capsular polysaccharide transport system permease protein
MSDIEKRRLSLLAALEAEASAFPLGHAHRDPAQVPELRSVPAAMPDGEQSIPTVEAPPLDEPGAAVAAALPEARNIPAPEAPPAPDAPAEEAKASATEVPPDVAKPAATEAPSEQPTAAVRPRRAKAAVTDSAATPPADADSASVQAPDKGPEIYARLQAKLERKQRARQAALQALPGGARKRAVEPIAPALRRPETPQQRAPIAPVTPLRQLPEQSAVKPIPALPQRARGSRGTLISFILFVVIPVTIVSIYYIWGASNQYVSEFRFAVREASSSTTSTTTSTISAALGSTISSAPVENYMVADYLTSRQIIDELEAKIKLKERYSRPQIDWWWRFDPTKPTEKFVGYWQDVVKSEYDAITGVAFARVRAFTPDDAYLIATTMVSLAEKLVNDISARARTDAVRFAEEEVKRAQTRLSEIREQLREYRDKEAVIDPNTNVVQSNTTLAQTLRSSLMQYQTELAALKKQNLRPDAPAIRALQSRIFGAKQQLKEVEAQVATAQEGNRPLSGVVGRYEQLDLERQVAQTILTGTLQSLEQARANASLQHLYITPFVRPARAESATYPNRFVAVLTAALGFFFIWTIGLLIFRSIREHLA